MIKTKISKGFQTVFPSEVRARLGGEPGDEIIWSVVGNEVFIHVRKSSGEDPLLSLVGAFETDAEDDATRFIDTVVHEG